MELLKIYDPTCAICSMLAGIDEEVAVEENLHFRKVTLSDVAKSPSPACTSIKESYVQDDGMVDLPIYMVISPQGEVQADGVVQTVEELKNLINAWKTWASSANARSVS